jgi:hypothetical protein
MPADVKAESKSHLNLQQMLLLLMCLCSADSIGAMNNLAYCLKAQEVGHLLSPCDLFLGGSGFPRFSAPFLDCAGPVLIGFVHLDVDLAIEACLVAAWCCWLVNANTCWLPPTAALHQNAKFFVAHTLRCPTPCRSTTYYASQVWHVLSRSPHIVTPLQKYTEAEPL